MNPLDAMPTCAKLPVTLLLAIALGGCTPNSIHVMDPATSGGSATQAGARSGESQASEPDTANSGAFAGYYATLMEAEREVDLERRCLAYPNFPGIQWSKDLVAARCAMLRKPLLNVSQVADLLAMEDGTLLLDKAYGDLLEQHYADPAQRDQIFYAMEVFKEEHAARAIVDAWVAKSPDSAFASLAQGLERLGAAWRARSEAPISMVSERQRALMNENLRDAVNAFFRAQQINRRLTPACLGISEAQRLSPRFGSAVATIERCIAGDPLSFMLAGEWQSASSARWGGNEDSERRLIEHVRLHEAENPFLATIIVRIAADRGGDAPSAVWLDILKAGPNSNAFEHLAKAFLAEGDEASARAAFSQAVRFEMRGGTRRFARYANESFAIEELRRKDFEEGFEYSHRYARRASLGATHDWVKAQGNSEDERGMNYQIDNCLLNSTLPGMEECPRELAFKYPENPEAWHSLAEWYLQRNDPRRKEAAEKFLRLATPENIAGYIGLVARYRSWLAPNPLVSERVD